MASTSAVCGTLPENLLLLLCWNFRLCSVLQSTKLTSKSNMLLANVCYQMPPFWSHNIVVSSFPDGFVYISLGSLSGDHLDISLHLESLVCLTIIIGSHFGTFSHENWSINHLLNLLEKPKIVLFNSEPQ
ncbi:hypothetical protein TNCT_472881 [Trichonephila clavata]|uniref:Uncharacterized protein n=1 Tax=Trichonephila clavata TaxID=2740835 RepID=A0A8X6L9M6_TRICU|nr:hypothetical protein TNCT_472881 [Trichonephila clavata]